jgi:hypothetical protein
MKPKFSTRQKNLLNSLNQQMGLIDKNEKLIPLNYAKFSGDIEYGSKVIIYWIDPYKEVIDYGYLMAWPFQDADNDPELGGIVHIPEPASYANRDQPPPEWHTLLDLSVNPLVTKVEFVKPK